MKKIILTAFVLGLGMTFISSQEAHAYKEEAVSRFAAKKTFGRKLRSAMQKRWNLDYKELYIRDKSYKNRLNQIERHKDGMFAGNVNERSTQSVRTGALTDYSGRRNNSESNYGTVNTPKRNFRRRAIDYYVDGGYADRPVLEQGTRMSTHRVKRIPDSYYNRGLFDSDIKDRIRKTQKALKSPDQVGAGQQRQRSYRKGSSYRSFSHPFMNNSVFGSPE